MTTWDPGAPGFQEREAAEERDARRVESEPWPFPDWTPPGPDPATNRRLREEHRARTLAENERIERERARMVVRLDVPHVNGATLGDLGSYPW